MSRCLRLAAVCLMLLSGCASPWAQRYGWTVRGPERYQQSWATVLDPYPDPDAGPEVVGGRPRDYDEPVPEVKRSRWPPSAVQRRGYSF